jgi:hypothetical protein
VEALVGLIASTPDAEERVPAVARLSALCRTGAITLVKRERDQLSPEIVTEVLGE